MEMIWESGEFYMTRPNITASFERVLISGRKKHLNQLERPWESWTTSNQEFQGMRQKSLHKPKRRY